MPRILVECHWCGATCGFHLDNCPFCFHQLGVRKELCLCPKCREKKGLFYQVHLGDYAQQDPADLIDVIEDPAEDQA